MAIVFFTLLSFALLKGDDCIDLYNSEYICSQEDVEGNTHHFYLLDEFHILIFDKWYEKETFYCHSYFSEWAGFVERNPVQEIIERLQHYMFIGMSAEDYLKNREELDKFYEINYTPTLFAQYCIDYHMAKVNEDIEYEKKEEEKKKGLKTIAKNINCN